MDRNNPAECLLELTADAQSIAAPHDKLTEVIDEYGSDSGTELEEEDLMRVQAAAKRLEIPPLKTILTKGKLSGK